MAEIQLCKIKAEEYAGSDHSTGDKKLILFSSAEQGFELVNKNEISAGGKMYDIVKTQTHNEIQLYYTLSDKDEDRYERHLTDMEKNNSEKKSLPGKTIKLYDDDAKYFTRKNYHPSICRSLNLMPGVMAVDGPLFYPSLLKDIFSPPPDRLFT